MESKFINRYHTFCKSLNNLEKSKHADPKQEFVLEGTVLNFNLTFDISWKVMKDILIKKMEILDFESVFISPELEHAERTPELRYEHIPAAIAFDENAFSFSITASIGEPFTQEEILP